ncbi:hypothetical protein I5H21_gp052 [Mycobacterium phage Byougenkin]|uniref:Uncharacterized protein n=1 Tax=Mycobacterium phage Byougenkin TaxID=2182394 RepID=A0A2U8UNJ1_9CAUD|nr:hypothetical protein I5H21_gp052 [Mycobacterium phage Byougenkin]AWN04976.1 hypothetical protein SEA_BYOUGENKIN_52 [Mycobacterium phage Byougenkin]
MNLKTALAAIEAILAAIPDEELPSFDRMEHGADGRVTAWYGHTGRVLGSATRGGIRNSEVYRTGASWSAIEGEMAYRADKKLLENNDEPAGLF